MRCDICDSTEFNNNLEVPITSWIRLYEGGDRCNVCHKSSSDNLYELSLDDFEDTIPDDITSKEGGEVIYEKEE